MSILDKDLISGKNKIETAIERIKLYCHGKKVLVSFSGGKDSQCCYHLCKEAGIDFTAQYSITRFEPPELISFVRSEYPDVIFRRAYKMSLISEIEKRGLPSRWYRWCCYAKHKRTEGFDISVIGIRMFESVRRKMRWSTFGRKNDGSYFVCPVFDWTDRDVWEYLNMIQARHCVLYDCGYKRIGCVCCPLSCNLIDVSRYPKFVKMLRVGFLKCIARRGEVLSEKTRGLLSKYADDPDLYFSRWLKYGTTEPRQIKLHDEPCLFAGSGFSESDGDNGLIDE